MSRQQTHPLALTRTRKQDVEQGVEIQWHRFEMEVIVEQVGNRFFAELAELGEVCFGGGNSADEAVLDFAQGFAALVDLHDSQNTLDNFLNKHFPDYKPESGRGTFDGTAEPPVDPWVCRSPLQGMSRALAA